MTNKANKDSLYEPNDGTEFEETEYKSYRDKGSKHTGRATGGIWGLPPSGHSLYKRSIHDRIDYVYSRLAKLVKICIDKVKIFVYNVYCKIVNHERTNKVNTSDNNKNKVKSTKSINMASIGNAIIGLCVMIAAASMIYSTTIMWLAGNGTTDKLLSAPAGLFAIAVIGKAFVVSSNKRGDK